MDSLSLDDKLQSVSPLIQAPDNSRNVEPSMLNPIPVHAIQPQQTASESGGAAEPKAQHVKEKERSAQAESSDTDQDAPVAKQMLSFVMDDPDFESEEEVVQKVTKVTLYLTF